MPEHKLCWKCIEAMEHMELLQNPHDHCHHDEPSRKPKENVMNLDKIILVRESPLDMSLKHGHDFLLTIRPGGIVRMGGLEFTDLPTDNEGRILFKE